MASQRRGTLLPHGFLMTELANQKCRSSTARRGIEGDYQPAFERVGELDDDKCRLKLRVASMSPNQLHKAVIVVTTMLQPGREPTGFRRGGGARSPPSL